MRERQEAAVGASRTAAGGGPHALDYRRGLAIATIAAFLMTLLGAFGTGGVPLWSRLAYWLVIMESGALIGIGASTGVRAWGRLIDRPVAEGATVSLLIALPLTLVVVGVTLVFFGGSAPPPAGIGAIFGGVFAVTAVITAINYLRGGQAVPPISDSAVPVAALVDAPPRPRFLDRLPPHLRHAELYAVEAEDHYLRVHTAAGSDLLLLRIGDAIAELDGIDGARTHRSWWVARDAVAAIERADGRAELTLRDGAVAPVSRSCMPTLRALGWFV